MSKSAPERDIYLDVEQARTFARDLGFIWSRDQMRRKATTGSGGKRLLPFFRLGNKLHISKRVLETHIARLQAAAERESRD